eukprot:434896-Rhodomonas_salina.1
MAFFDLLWYLRLRCRSSGAWQAVHQRILSGTGCFPLGSMTMVMMTTTTVLGMGMKDDDAEEA